MRKTRRLRQGEVAVVVVSAMAVLLQVGADLAQSRPPKKRRGGLEIVGGQ